MSSFSGVSSELIEISKTGAFGAPILVGTSDIRSSSQMVSRLAGYGQLAHRSGV